VKAKLRTTKQNIEELPHRPEGDPVAAVWKLLAGFKKDVAQLVSGRPEDGEKGLIQILRESRGQFREAIFRQAPDFKPYEQDSRESGVYETASSGSVQGGEMLEPTGPRDAKTVIYLDEVLDMAQKWEFLPLLNFKTYQYFSAITRELPHNYPYAVKKYFVARFTREWPVPATQLFEKMEREFTRELRDLVKRHFAEFSAGGLEGMVL
jgi:hypothetical protein